MPLSAALLPAIPNSGCLNWVTEISCRFQRHCYAVWDVALPRVALVLKYHAAFSGIVTSIRCLWFYSRKSSLKYHAAFSGIVTSLSRVPDLVAHSNLKYHAAFSGIVTELLNCSVFTASLLLFCEHLSYFFPYPQPPTHLFSLIILPKLLKYKLNSGLRAPPGFLTPHHCSQFTG